LDSRFLAIAGCQPATSGKHSNSIICEMEETRTMIPKKASILLAAAIAFFVSGCGTTGGTASKAVIDENSTDPNVLKAVEIYKKDCLVCHGPQLEGKMANSKIDKVGGLLKPEEIKSKIMKGGNGMIGYKDRLSEEEITLLTDWLATKK
jgi:cytochrome c551